MVAELVNKKADIALGSLRFHHHNDDDEDDEDDDDNAVVVLMMNKILDDYDDHGVNFFLMSEISPISDF